MSVSNLLAAAAWFVLATMIALLRPELSISRHAYIAGMVMGCFMLWRARVPAMPWLPAWWRTALNFVLPLYPIHLAIRTQTRRWNRHPDQSHRGCLNVRLPAPRLARSVYFPLPDHVKR